MEKEYLETEDFSDFRLWPIFQWDTKGFDSGTVRSLDQFWDLFFGKKLSFFELIKRYNYAIYRVKDGPLSTWLSWLKEKHICYLYIRGSDSIDSLSKKLGIDSNFLSQIVRNFLVEKYPEKEKELNESFLIGHKLSANLQLKYSDICSLYGLQKQISGICDDDVMSTFNVTHYRYWASFIKDFEMALNKKKVDEYFVKRREKIKYYWEFIQEVSLLTFSAVILILFLIWINKFYDDYLIKKVGLIYPDFLQVQENLPVKEVIVKQKEDWKLEDEFKAVEAQLIVPSFAEEERYETESDVVLGSFEDEQNVTPHRIGYVRPSSTEKEEQEKSSFRDQYWGENKVYRIMIRSNQIKEIKSSIQAIMDKYQVTSATNTKKGQIVPGGVYFNLLVPKKNLNDFLHEAGSAGLAQLIVGHNRRPGPPDKGRVFVWIKEI